MAAISKAIRVASLQLGPITVEVGVHGAVEDDDLGLVSVCVHTASPSHQGEPPSTIKRVDSCRTCGSIERSDWVKGKASSAGITIVDQQALEALEPTVEQRKTIPLTVHPAGQLARAFPSGKSYYLAPRKGGENNYALFAQVLATAQDKAFVGEFSFGGPPALYQASVVEGVLTLRQLARPELVRERPEVAGLVNDDWLKMALQWTDLMVTDYDPADYADKRAAALARLLAESVPMAVISEGGGGGDLGSLLSLALAKAKGEKEAAAAPAPRKRAARRAKASGEPLAS